MKKGANVRNNLIVLFALIVFASLLTWIVMAVAGEGVIIQTPASGTNYTTISAVVFNVSFTNGSDITNPANATFYINLSGNWAPIGNTTPSSGCQVGATISSCAVTITNTTILDGVYTVNATIFNGSNTISVTNTTNVSSKIVIDGTVPQAFINNFTGNVLANTNLSSKISGLYYINASLVDVTIGIETVVFNVTNISGKQNATFTATREGTSIYYAASINTSNFQDGTYNITIFVNDTLGNLNNSARAADIKFDDTVPAAFPQNFTGTVAANVNLSSRSGNTLYYINASLVDVTAGIQGVLFNVTNISGKQNATFTATREGTTTYYSASINTSQFQDGTYNVTIFVNDSSGNLNNSARIASLIFDDTVPAAFINNFTGNVLANTNLSSKKSGLYYINASLVDVTAGIQGVLFNVTNISGKQNATFTATREGTTTYYSASINTSQFQDGTYNVTIFVNDSSGNLNNSARVATIKFDDTPPIISFSCSPATVTEGEVVTCSCSATDAVAGLNTSYGSAGVSTTTNPSTTQTGSSFSVGCSSQDSAGNLQTATATYAVNPESGGGSGGSGGPGLSPPSSTSNGSSSTGSETNATGGEEGAGSNVGSSAQGTGQEQAESSLGISTGLIIAIIVIVVIVVIIIVIVKRKK